MSAETVSSFEQTEDGWSLEVEVLELARVPDTMSLMASYQVDLDPEGQLTGYRRVRRYAGGIADWEEAGYPLERGPKRATPKTSLVVRAVAPA